MHVHSVHGDKTCFIYFCSDEIEEDPAQWYGGWRLRKYGRRHKYSYGWNGYGY